MSDDKWAFSADFFCTGLFDVFNDTWNVVFELYYNRPVINFNLSFISFHFVQILEGICYRVVEHNTGRLFISTLHKKRRINQIYVTDKPNTVFIDENIQILN